MVKRNSGFTLIELIIVIVILGILAVTAAPRFIDFTSDANEATIVAMEGALETSVQLVYAKALIAKLDEQPLASLDLNGDGTDDINIRYGRPDATAADGIVNTIEFDESQWAWSVNSPGVQFWMTTASILGRSGVLPSAERDDIINTGCYVTYVRPIIATTPYYIETDLTKC